MQGFNAMNKGANPTTGSKGHFNGGGLLNSKDQAMQKNKVFEMP
jgi:hypothetical protein